MSNELKPRRSVLYMPAANERALEKAKAIAADALIFDLEDAVAPDAKADARAKATAAVAGGGYGGRELTIRANGLDTPWGEDDIAAISAVGPSAIVIPKVANAAHLDQVAAIMEKSGAPEHTMIWAMVETPEAVFCAREIAAHPRLAAVVMGTNDLAKELRATQVPSRHPLIPHLSTTLLAVREAGKVVLDGVYNNIKDEAGFLAECVQGMEMGFDGKTLIHPSQVGPTNDTWSPSAEEIDHSRRVIEAFEEAEADGRGVVTVDGRMIENLHVDNARLVLATADAIAAL